jgi:hypothetical protein
VAAEAALAAEGITAAKKKAEAARAAATAAAGGATSPDGRPRRHTWAGEQLGRLQATLVSEQPFKLSTRRFRLDMSQAACLHSPQGLPPTHASLVVESCAGRMRLITPPPRT